MKKNDLIKALENIKGNPDVVVYNGFVDDYQHIGDIKEDRLYKDNKKYLLKMINLQNKIMGRPTIESIDREFTWEFVNEFLTEEQVGKVYEKKTKPIILISLKNRHKKSLNRFGSLTY